jgi:hypothetical protein
MGTVMKAAYELADCSEAVPFDQIEDNVYNEMMLMINVDAPSLIKLFEAEIELVNKFKVDESKLYTDRSDSEEDENN